MTAGPFAGRAIFVTAGATRTGAAIAQYCARQGAQIYLNYFSNHTGASALEAEFGIQQIKLLQGDVTDAASVSQMFQTIQEQGTGLDGVINIVGDYHEEPVMQTSLEDYHHVLKNNLDPVFLLAKAAHPLLTEAHYPRFVTFAYAKGDQVTSAKAWAYHIAKMGVISLTKTLAKEWGPEQISTHVISPGTLFNSIVCESDNPKDYIPQERFGEYRDLWPILDLIFRDDSTYLTGNNFVVSGGYNV